ncbi:MAG: NAD(P)/FAD-dependent oxidoreductase [Sphaerobacter sp.]|nr:NAD(P)/FAD-dependent oxidoreductase [Sphaerobacter sp.]
MQTAHAHRPSANRNQPEFDAVVVGAGFSGLYMLHRLRQLGVTTRVYEAGGGVGGTWYWNRYPGARCDSESWVYCYSFSDEILQEWTWTERYPSQPEIERYLNYVADRLDLRRDIQFNTRVTAAAFDEATGRWLITTDAGEQVWATYFITAVGCLSADNLPAFKGLETFQGEWYHTGRWPQEGIDFTGKRVGLIGTGATGIQVAPVVAEQAEHLWVFQRTPNYAIPAHNRPLDPEFIRQLKASYGEVWEIVRRSAAGLPIEPVERSALAVSPEEQRQIYEAAWQKGGFYFLFETFNDILVNPEANETAAAFIRSKIRETVRDPEVAELLCPSDHPYGTKRPPLEHGYYEAFNRDNVTLVDVRKSPIEEITPTGIRTTDGEYPLDIIIFATGFDALTGPLTRIDIRGRGGVALAEKWVSGPRNYLGVAVHGFPNMFTITGPLSPSVLTNMPAAISQHVEWIADCIGYLRQHGYRGIEATADAEDRWVAHANEAAEQTLYPRAKSWYIGANVPGKPRVFMVYVGGLQNYRARCQEIASKGYEGFSLTPEAALAVGAG